MIAPGAAAALPPDFACEGLSLCTGGTSHCHTGGLYAEAGGGIFAAPEHEDVRPQPKELHRGRRAGRDPFESGEGGREGRREPFSGFRTRGETGGFSGGRGGARGGGGRVCRSAESEAEVLCVGGPSGASHRGGRRGTAGADGARRVSHRRHPCALEGGIQKPSRGGRAARGGGGASRGLRAAAAALLPEGFEDGGTLRARRDAPRSQAALSLEEVRAAYRLLAARTGFPSVAISALQQESAAPLAALQEWLLGEHRAGRAILSRGDWSLADEAKRGAAVEWQGQPYLLARLLE